MTDYERGVEQASAIYKEVIRDYVAENAKLRELCTDFAAMLTLAGLEGLMVEATIGGITKTYDASELCDMAENLCDEAS